MKREIISLCCAWGAATATLWAQPADSAKQITMQEVVVMATRADTKTPMAYTNMDEGSIAKQNAGRDIPYLLSLTPSVVVNSDAGTGIGYTNFSVRGTDANRINITVNGIPINDAESHGVFWVNMPDLASSLQNIQVQRGVGTSTNGAAAFGATVSMQTELLRTKPYAEYSGAAGSFGTFKNTVKAGTGLIKNRLSLDMRLSNILSDGYVDRASSNLKSYYAALGYYGENTMLKFVTFGGKEKTYQSWNGVPSTMLDTARTFNSCGMYEDENGNVHFYNNQTDNYTQLHHQLLWTQRLSSEWNLNLGLHYTPGEGYYEDYKAGEDLADFLLPDYINGTDTMTSSDLVRQKWVASDFYGATFSLTYDRTWLKATLGGAVNRYVGDHYGFVTWVKDYPTTLYSPGNKFYNGTGTKSDANIFTKINAELLPGLNAYADLQYRHIGYKIDGTDDNQNPLNVNETFNFFNPKVGLLYTLNEQHQLFASFAVGHREPTRDNYTEAGPDESPTFETLYDYELGYTFSHPRFSLGANAYFMDYTNQLVLTGKLSDIGEALTSNIPDSYRMGVELMGGVKITDWLRWDANLTLSQNKIRNFTEYVDDWNTGDQVENKLGTTDIALSPNVIANSIFDFNLKGFSAGLHTAYVGRQYADNTSSKDRSINPYCVTNLRAGYGTKWKKLYFNLDFLVNNLFNEKYETKAWVYSYYYNGERGKDDGYFPQAGTNFMVKLDIKF